MTTETAIHLAEMAAGIGIALASIALVALVGYAICALNRSCRQRYDWPIGYEAGRKPGVTYTTEGSDTHD